MERMARISRAGLRSCTLACRLWRYICAGLLCQQSTTHIGLVANKFVQELTSTPHFNIVFKTYGGGDELWSMALLHKNDEPMFLIFRNNATLPAARFDYETARARWDKLGIKGFQPAICKPVTRSQALNDEESWFLWMHKRSQLQDDLQTCQLNEPSSADTNKVAASRIVKMLVGNALEQLRKIDEQFNRDREAMMREEAYLQRIKDEQNKRSVQILKQSVPRGRQTQRKKKHQRKAGKSGPASESSQHMESPTQDDGLVSSTRDMVGEYCLRKNDHDMRLPAEHHDCLPLQKTKQHEQPRNRRQGKTRQTVCKRHPLGMVAELLADKDQLSAENMQLEKDLLNAVFNSLVDDSIAVACETQTAKSSASASEAQPSELWSVQGEHTHGESDRDI